MTSTSERSWTSEEPALPDSESRYPPPLLVPPSLPPSHPPTPPGSVFTLNMGKEKERSRIDIILDAPYVVLRGTTGTTVEPAVLSGHVSLYLVEDTDIREVSLHFRGKARIPVPATESFIHNCSMQNYTFFSHDWSFLQSTCNSSSSPSNTTVSSGKRPLPLARTLKAGRHIFPFTFTITGNFPSTLTTHPLNLNTSAFPTNTRASITYKLRAVASRPGLSLGPGPLQNVHIMPMMLHNLTCTIPVYVLRSLSPVALEYQQSLEMENTWPEKLMYAIMLPHRAWAAGDTLIAVLKLSPLAKGVWVENVVTTLLETTELHDQQHHQPKNALHLPHHSDKSNVVHTERRIVRCVKHEIVNGKAVKVDLVSSATAKSSRGSNTPAGSSSPRPGSSMDYSSSFAQPTSRVSTDTFIPGPASAEEGNRFTDEEFENHDIVTYLTFPIPHLATGPYMSPQTTPTATSPPSMMPGSSMPASGSMSIPQSRPPSPSSYSYSPTPLPAPPGSSTTPSSFDSSSTPTVNPTHNLSPITVSHRIRWSFCIHNRDGHISELRCSLPIYILDGRVLSEAREASVITRRMTLAAEGLWRGEEDEGELGLGMGAGESNEGGGDVYVDRELPSYTAHVRDRVANMYYSEMTTVRMPWANVVAGGDGTTTDHTSWEDGNTEGGSPHLRSQSRRHSHLLSYQRSSRSASGRNTPRHLPPLNQPHEHHQLPQAPSTSSTSSPLDWVNSELMSLSLSNSGRSEPNQSGAHDSPQVLSEGHSRSESPERCPGVGSGLPTTSAGHCQAVGGGGGHSVRRLSSLSSLFKATVRPFVALGHHHGNGGRGLFGLSKSSSPQDDNIPSSSPSSTRISPTRRASNPPTLPSASSFPGSTGSNQAIGSSPAIHRPLSQVPDYSVASQGFMGGVPPLSSLMGLPSYEEAAREGYMQPQANHNDVEALSRSGPSSNVDNLTSRETVSDTNLLGRFGRLARAGLQQRLERDGNLSGSEDEEEGIQMKTRARGL